MGMTTTEGKVRLTKARREVRPYTPSYKLFGILNPSGQFWSHKVYLDAATARKAVETFWPNCDAREWDRFTIVPVRVTLELDQDTAETAGRAALSPEREGGADG